MSYHIGSVLALSPNNQHDYFIYYISGNRLEFVWVDTWMQNHFQRIASSVGTKGVIISPSDGHYDQYLADMGNLQGTEGYFFYHCGATDDDFLNTGGRFLIFSRTPLVKDETNEAIAINLTQCKDEIQLAQIIDILIDTIKKDDMTEINRLTSILRKIDPYPWKEYLDVLELKPNFFGLDVNFNAVLERIALSVREYKSKKDR